MFVVVIEHELLHKFFDVLFGFGVDDPKLQPTARIAAPTYLTVAIFAASQKHTANTQTPQQSYSFFEFTLPSQSHHKHSNS